MRKRTYFTDGEFSGGETGSQRVNGADGIYQLKPSILDNPKLLRRVKSGFSDRENFGEVIAAIVAKSIATSAESVPELCTVYDEEKKKISVASRYLVGDKVQTLDEYLNDQGGKLAKGKKHFSIVHEDSNKASGRFGINDPIIAPLKKGLADAIVLSALLGDHDINPGNMLVVTKNGKPEVARIDYGHALNDLLNASKINGGKLRDRDNPILDFFNREQVAGVGGDPSKLWRDYPGLSPSKELVDALREASKGYEDKLKQGIQNAKDEFNSLRTACKGDPESLAHINKSLSAIYYNVNGKNLDLSQSDEQIMEEAFSSIERFVKNNCDNLEKVANAMELQLAIDDYLIAEKPLPDHIISMLRQNEFPLKDGKQQWLKTATTNAFSGSVEKFIRQRGKNLNTDPERLKTLLSQVRTIKTDQLKIGEDTSQFDRALEGRGQAEANNILEMRANVLLHSIRDELNQLDTNELCKEEKKFRTQCFSILNKKNINPMEKIQKLRTYITTYDQPHENKSKEESIFSRIFNFIKNVLGIDKDKQEVKLTSHPIQPNEQLAEESKKIQQFSSVKERLKKIIIADKHPMADKEDKENTQEVGEQDLKKKF